jgi:D-3-phosphoglycerate dehydrogenase
VSCPGRRAQRGGWSHTRRVRSLRGDRERPVPQRLAGPDLRLTSVDDVPARSDVLVLCAALTDSSQGILGREALANVKLGLTVMDLGRGGLVDEASLGEALHDGRVAVAALDVRAVEPSDPPADPLAGFDKVITTPHIASASIEAIADLATQSVDCVLTLLEQGGRIELRTSHA